MDKDKSQGLELFEQGLLKFNIVLDSKQKDQFLKYYDLLIEWNKVMNLTAITEFFDVIEKHFLDSLSIENILHLSNEWVLDIGTGAGFPGIPLKIVFPELEVVLLDSLNKRIYFLDHVIKELDLKKIRTIHGRAEDFGHDIIYRETFDLCVSRAVAKLSTLAEYCIPYVKKGGYFVPYKSGKIDDEIKDGKKAINLLGAEIEKVYDFSIPGTDIDRSLITIYKKEKTPRKYPRSAGKPSKEPL